MTGGDEHSVRSRERHGSPRWVVPDEAGAILNGVRDAYAVPRGPRVPDGRMRLSSMLDTGGPPQRITAGATVGAVASSSLRSVSSLMIAMAASVLGGLCLAAAAAPWDAWPLAIVGVALCLLALRGRSPLLAAAVGSAGGAALYAVQISWIAVYLGPVPLVGLTALMASWYGLGGIAAAWTWRLMSRLPRTVAAPATSTALAAVWSARESLSSAFPWGGFPWGRLAHTQAGGPLAEPIAWVGMPGLTFLIAAIGAASAVALAHRNVTLLRASTWPVAAAVIALLVPSVPLAPLGELRVGAVQGASEAGLLAPYVPGQILAQHAEASERLAGEEMDVLVWPENAGETDPQRDADAAATIDRVQEMVDAPIVLGAIQTTSEATYNSLLLWDDGVRAEYRKRRPVPFAEYLPARPILAPVLDWLGFLDFIPRDYSIDPTSVNAFDVAGTAAGLFICFDIVDDGLLRESILEAGATILFSPSNNADFGKGSPQSLQQLAIARLRAMESGRALVLSSTVGTSAVILPDGSTIDRLTAYEPGVMLETLPLSDTVTPGIALGGAIEIAVNSLAAFSTAAALLLPPRIQRRRWSSEGRVDSAGRIAEGG